MGRVSGKSDADGIEMEHFNWGAYDLVVIDESHNFRGNPMEKTKEDGTTTMNRAKWLMEKVIKSGVSFSFDYYSNDDELLIFCGLLDLSRNNKVGELVSFKNNLFTYDKVITLPRESEKVRDIFEVQFMNRNTVLLNEESLKIITLNIESGKIKIYHTKENNRISYIEYFNMNA